MISRQGPKYLKIIIGDYTKIKAKKQIKTKKKIKTNKEIKTFKLKIYKVFNSNKEIKIIDSKIKTKDFKIKNIFFTRYKMPCYTRVKKKNLIFNI